MGRPTVASPFDGNARQLQRRRQAHRSGSMQAVKLRMKQVKNIAKITKAMQMVASSKLRGAQARVEASRPMTSALSGLFGSLEKSEENPDGVELNPKSDCLVTITSDAGLCGGVNTILLKMVRLELVPAMQEKGIEVSVVGVGDKGRSILRRAMPENIACIMTGVFGSVKPNFSVAACIAAEALETNSDNCTVVFNTFINTIAQEPFQKYETEDERTECLESFAEFNLAVSIFGALLENNCSEIASKMTAMDNATRNANDMFDALELKYNKARQAAITTELIEIISGAESLKG